MNKNQNKILEKLQEDVVIPELVQKKADAAFAAIHSEVKDNAKKDVVRNRKIPRKRMWLLVAAVVVTLGAVSVGAATYIKWSRSFSEGMQTTEGQKHKLEEIHMASPVGQSVTDNGITVTVEQSIVDNYYAYIAFKVEGYEAANAVQPDFENLKVLIDGKDGTSSDIKDGFSAIGYFYNGLITNNDGDIVYPDGMPLQWDENGNSIERYVMEDGSMEYNVLLNGYGNEGNLIDKPIHVELENIGTVEKAAYIPDIEGNWAFDWTLKGSSEKAEYNLEAPVGDSGAMLLRAEISPISIYTECRFPRQKVAEIASEEGEEPYIKYAEPPELRGVKMKDGTLYTDIVGGGIQGYKSKDSDVYRKNLNFEGIFDIDQIDALLFLKSYPEGEEGFKEDNFYIVPLEGFGG